MGGIGSGRSSFSRFEVCRPVNEQSYRFDLRSIKTLPGYYSYSWYRNGKECSNINYQAQSDRVILYYHTVEESPKHFEITIYLETTPCNYGGVRNWFKCPKCGRKCLVLYLNKAYPVCGKCGNITYSVCNDDDYQIVNARIRKLKTKMNKDKTTHCDYYPIRQKGMHLTTYDCLFQRLSATYDNQLIEENEKLLKLIKLSNSLRG